MVAHDSAVPAASSWNPSSPLLNGLRLISRTSATWSPALDELSLKIHSGGAATSGDQRRMKGKLIKLFMWSYQPHFRFEVESRMNSVMEEFGVSEAGAQCLLVGARIPGHQNPHGVCVEPEDGKWPINLFDGLLDVIEAEVANHPLQNVFYGDEPRMRDKPENIRRDSVRAAVQKTLNAYDPGHGVRSFAGSPAPVNDYYVVPVLQLPDELFEHFRPLREPVSDGRVTGHASLIHAAVFEALTEAHDELLRPDPGRYLVLRSRSPEEIARRAAASFMCTPGVAIGDQYSGNRGLFERFNSISSLMYEGAKGTGLLLLAKPDGGSVDMLLSFAEPVPFRDPRWSRKVLQMASSEIALIADCEKIFGLGSVAAGVDPWTSQNVFAIEFLDHYHWCLSCGEEVMLVSRDGAPSLPREVFPRYRLLDIYRRLFPEAVEEDVSHFSALFDAAVDRRHGSMLIVAKDAEIEANRLRGQGTRIEPTKLTPDLYHQVSRIDGTVIIDPHGVCHAIGVILDGPARSECTPSRGARYNSGIRYVRASDTPRLAVVVSDDQTVDVIPILHPRIKRSAIDVAIADLEAATHDNYHSAISWLDRHRFYLNQGQCDRINAALKRIQIEPMEVGEMRAIWNEFLPDPDLDDTYFESEDAKPDSP